MGFGLRARVEKHIVGLELHMGLVCNRKNIEYCQTYSLNDTGPKF